VQEDAEDPSAQAPQRHATPGGLGAIGEGTAYAPNALANHRDVSPATAPIIQIGDSPGSRIHASLGMQIGGSARVYLTFYRLITIPGIAGVHGTRTGVARILQPVAQTRSSLTC
jgi:hypothetical protein